METNLNGLTERSLERKEKLLLTTALPYSSGRLHVGHVLESTIATVKGRAFELLGFDVRRSCCTDAHGAPVALAAAKAGKSVEAWLKEITDGHGSDLRALGLWEGDWGNTHTDRNRRLSEICFSKARDLGLLNETEAPRPFCPVTGAAQPDRFIEGICPVCGASAQGGEDCPRCQEHCPPERLLEARCSQSGARPEFRKTKSIEIDVRKAFSVLGIEKESLLNLAGEVLAGKAKEWLDDPKPVDICRPQPYFGWPCPNDESLAFQVWWDAHLGYLSAVSDEVIDELRSGDRDLICHIGKDIVRFHLTIFPIQLRLLGLPLPRELSIHGFVVDKEGRKFSKSLGNAPDLDSFLSGAEPALRLSLALSSKEGIADCRFDKDDPKRVWNERVVGGIANLVARSSTLAGGRFHLEHGEIVTEESASCVESMAEGRVAKGLEEAFAIADRAQRRFATETPWKKEGAERVRTCREAYRAAVSAAWAISPCVPEVLKAVLNARPGEIVIPRIV